MLSSMSPRPHEDIDWLFSRHAEFGINYDPLQSEAVPEVTTTANDRRYDPMRTVLFGTRGRRRARLGTCDCGDGKQGAFNEASVRSYFGARSMPQTLTGTGVRRSDEGLSVTG
ncbi:hypothetical protein ASD03_31945 [Ensifer sp. Root127]|nr:hypothetical protein ASD03_31945 [Ensifer sp. Root127]